jgi:hypothetical protein
MSDVTQADREAAWPHRSIIYTEGDKQNWMDGAYDRAVPLIRKFSAYRIAAYAAGLAAGIAQERERCSEIADKESDGFETTQLKYFRELCANTLAVVASRETAERIAAAIRSGT